MKLVSKSLADKLPPSWAGKIVAMMEHNGHVYVACESAVFLQLDSEGPFRPIAFMSTNPNAAPKDEAHGD